MRPFRVDSALGAEKTSCSDSSRLNLLANIARQTLSLPHLAVGVGQQVAGSDKLDYVDELLGGHDGQANAGNDPGHGRVHLVGAGELQGGGAEGVREDLLEDRGVDGVAGLHGLAALGLDRLDEMRGEQGRGEGEEVEGDEEDLVHGAKDEEDGLVGVVKVEYPVLALVDVLVARLGAIDDESSIHVDVVASKVEGDQALEENGEAREGRGEKDEQARGGASIGDHVEDGAEAGGLLESASEVAIEGIEETRDAVEKGARARMQRHVVERCECEDDASVADDVGPEEEDVLGSSVVCGDGRIVSDGVAIACGKISIAVQRLLQLGALLGGLSAGGAARHCVTEEEECRRRVLRILFVRDKGAKGLETKRKRAGEKKSEELLGELEEADRRGVL
jgi:hypothetical protein